MLVSPQADFLSKIHGLKIHGGSAGYLCWLSLWVRPCVCACVCSTALSVFRRKSHTTHKNGLNSGLYDLIGIRLLKRIINPNKRPKIKPYGRVRFLSVSQRMKKRKKVGTNGLLCTVYCIDIIIVVIRKLRCYKIGCCFAIKFLTNRAPIVSLCRCIASFIEGKKDTTQR